MGLWKTACKLALGKVLNDKACVVKPIALRQGGGESTHLIQGIVRKTAGLLSTIAAHKYISTKAMQYTICVTVALYRIALQLYVFLVLAAIL